MTSEKQISARFDDLLLTVIAHDQHWRARVEEIGDPDSAISGGIEYQSIERAKQGAIGIALELFGTRVPPDELEWQPTPDPTAH